MRTRYSEHPPTAMTAGVRLAIGGASLATAVACLLVAISLIAP